MRPLFEYHGLRDSLISLIFCVLCDAWLSDWRHVTLHQGSVTLHMYTPEAMLCSREIWREQPRPHPPKIST